MGNRNGRSNISIFAVTILLLIVLLIVSSLTGGLFGVFKSDKSNSESNDDVSSNDSANGISNSESDEFGKLYFNPVDEEHIVADEDDEVKYIDNEILVVVKDGISEEEVSELAEKYDAEIVGEIEATGDYQLKLKKACSEAELDSIIDKLRSEDIIDSASLNYVGEYSEDKKVEERDGFYYGEKWQDDLQNFNNCKGKSWGIEAIETLAAWDLLKKHSKTVKPVKIGVIDQGFDTSHDDLKFAEVFYENGNNKKTSTDREHGTHVAGTMASDNSNKTGICGVYPYGSGNLYGVSAQGVQDYSENGTYCQSAMWQKCAFAELIVRNVKVINSSLNNRRDRVNQIVDKSPGWEKALEELKGNADLLGDFLERLYKKGYDYCICSAAGNSSSSKTGHLDAQYNSFLNYISKSKYPDVYDRIIVVGAIDNKLNVSNYSNGGNRVDIYAPGDDIYSTIPKNKYDIKSGTSMASPHVSGVAAMVWSANNSLTGAEVKEAVCHRGNFRCTSCKMVDAYTSVEHAFGKDNTGFATEVENGIINCYVVNKDKEDEKIKKAKITVKNTETGEEYSETTDDLGHFELTVPGGKYTLTVSADGYKDYVWPDGHSEYQNPVSVSNGQVNYLDDWIKMTKKENKKETEKSEDKENTTEMPTEKTTEASEKNDESAETEEDKPADQEISTDEEEFYEALEDDYKDLDYGVPLNDVMAWTFYDGHVYALFDYAVSYHAMSLITAIKPSVHLVNISNKHEQAVVEKLITKGKRELYFTGGTVDFNGELDWISEGDSDYSNWYEDCPKAYGEFGYDDVVTIFRGEGRSNKDFGKWIEIRENLESYLAIFDNTTVNGSKCGVIIEWEGFKKH